MHTTIEQYCDAASLVAYMSCTDENVINAIEITAKVCAQIKKEGLQEGELVRTKRLLKGAYVRSMESTEHRMYRLGRDFMLNGKCHTMEERLMAIEAVTEEDVMRGPTIYWTRSISTSLSRERQQGIKKFDPRVIEI